MKSRDGKSQRREEEKKKYQKKESLRRKKIQVREKVGCRETLCFCNDLISIIAIFNPRSWGPDFDYLKGKLELKKNQGTVWYSKQ